MQIVSLLSNAALNEFTNNAKRVHDAILNVYNNGGDRTYYSRLITNMRIPLPSFIHGSSLKVYNGDSKMPEMLVK